MNYKRKRGQAKRLRQNPTKTEKILWERIRKQQLGIKFTRQKVLCGYIADFYCSQKKLVIEIDGPRHGELKRRAHDAERDAVLWKKKRIRTLRLESKLIIKNITLALQTILNLSHTLGTNQ